MPATSFRFRYLFLRRKEQQLRVSSHYEMVSFFGLISGSFRIQEGVIFLCLMLCMYRMKYDSGRSNKYVVVRQSREINRSHKEISSLWRGIQSKEGTTHA